MSKFKVPVVWQMKGHLEIEASTPEEAFKIAEYMSKECPLPSNGEYLEDSFEVDTEGALLELHDNTEHEGKWNESEKALEELALRIDSFMYIHNPYDYGDNIGSSPEEREQAIEDIVHWLKSGANDDTLSIVNTLQVIRDDFDIVAHQEDIKEANDLIHSLQNLEAYIQNFNVRKESSPNYDNPSLSDLISSAKLYIAKGMINDSMDKKTISRDDGPCL